MSVCKQSMYLITSFNINKAVIFKHPMVWYSLFADIFLEIPLFFPSPLDQGLKVEPFLIILRFSKLPQF